MASGDYWACGCCDDEGPYPYSGPYGSGPYGGPTDPCDCCGEETVVFQIDDATNEPDAAVILVFECPEPPCDFNGFTRQWAELIGQSVTLNVCYEDCSATCSVKQYIGCARLNMTWKSRYNDGVAQCPDQDWGHFIGVCLTCIYRIPDGKRSVSIKIKSLERPDCFAEVTDCQAFLVASFADCDCDAVEAAFCTEDPPTCDEWTDTPNGSPLINIGATTDLGTCTTECGGSIYFQHEQTGAGAHGINGVSIHF